MNKKLNSKRASYRVCLVGGPSDGGQLSVEEEKSFLVLKPGCPLNETGRAVSYTRTNGRNPHTKRRIYSWYM